MRARRFPQAGSCEGPALIDLPDLARLSPHDFELLVRDVAHRRLGREFESFGPGRDRGIDLRSRGDGPLAVVQCKHYTDSSQAALIAAVRREASHVSRLSPAHYVVATSRRATPGNKDELETVIDGWAPTTEVWTGNNLVDDLNGDPDLVLHHPKLWMLGNAVLRQLLNRAQHARTREFLRQAQDEVPAFVTSDLRQKASGVLHSHGTVVLTGDPGAGKTSLAKNLALEFAADGYDIHLLVRGIEEGHQLLEADAKQLFIFDDFLGRSKLDDIVMRNEGSDLSLFCSAIRRSQSAKLILTSRSYVLNAAVVEDETLKALAESLDRVVVSVSAYSDADRAGILYNHLYYSELPLKSLAAFAQSRLYWSIIRHANYTPRLITAIIDRAVRDRVRPQAFTGFFRDRLENPGELWTDVFRHLRAREKLLLAAVRVCDGDRLTELEESWRAAMSQPGLAQEASTLAFQDSLRVLEPTFVRIAGADDWRTVGFSNPGVADVLSDLLAADATLVRAALSGIARPWQLRKLEEWSSPRGHTGDALDLSRFRDDVRTMADRLSNTQPAAADAAAFARVVTRARLAWEDVSLLGMLLRTVDDLELEEVVPFWGNLPPDDADSIVRDALVERGREELRLKGILDAEMLVAAAEFLREFGRGIAVDPDRLTTQAGDVVADVLEAAAEGSLPPVDLDDVISAAEEFGVYMDDDLIWKARSVAYYEPDHDSHRSRFDAPEPSDIDRLFGTLGRAADS